MAIRIRIKRDNRKAVLREVQRRSLEGLEAAARQHAGIFYQGASRVREAGPPFLGPHSRPGQYPHVETGQGIDNIDYGVDKRKMEARSGLRGDIGPYPPTHDIPGGLHLWFLEQLGGRLGMAYAFWSGLARIRRAFKTRAVSGRAPRQGRVV